MEDKVISLINEGERNIIIDLSNVDYLYSDSINTFIELNHRIINVWGRIALYSPNENLSKILKRSGIEKFLIIYSNEKEVKNATKKIIEQTSTLHTKDVKNYTPEKKKKVSHQKNNDLYTTQSVHKSSKDLALFEIQSFKDSLNTFCKNVMYPLIERITRIEEILLNDTNTAQQIPDEVSFSTTFPEDNLSEEGSSLNTVFPEDGLSEEDQNNDEQNDIALFSIDEKPGFPKVQEEKETSRNNDKKKSSDDNEEFFLEDNI